MSCLLAAVALGLGACGGAGGAQHVVPAARSAVGGGPVHGRDRDNDADNNDDDAGVLGYGHAASAADRAASVALVARYYGAAAREDGAKACALLVPFVAESVVENGRESPALRGRTCAAVVSKLFKLHHRLLAEKSATLRVIAVRVEGGKALAVIQFPTLAEARMIPERRVRGAWRMQNLLDSILE